MRRGPGPGQRGKFDVEQLVKDVKRVYDGYSAEKLEEVWQYKEHVMSEFAHDGSNTYERHRKRAVRRMAGWLYACEIQSAK